MENLNCAGVAALLAEVADFLASLPALADLPALHSLDVTDSYPRGWRVRAQIGGDHCGEPAEIDAIRAWAHALGGHLELSKPSVSSYGNAFRTLTAVTTLPGGARFTVWAHIDRHPTTTAPRLVTA